VGFWLAKAEAEKDRVGAWKLRLEMQQARLVREGRTVRVDLRELGPA
jgi:hypothetical protein